MKKDVINLFFTMVVGIVIYILIVILVDTFIKNIILLNTIIIISTILLFIFALFIFKSELKIGNYECKNCKHLFKPEYKKALFAPHIGFRRYLKCPKCNKKSWDKKVFKEK